MQSRWYVRSAKCTRLSAGTFTFAADVSRIEVPSYVNLS